ncbi:unnamed protein product, partial [Pleuronectes platessa]
MRHEHHGRLAVDSQNPNRGYEVSHERGRTSDEAARSAKSRVRHVAGARRGLDAQEEGVPRDHAADNDHRSRITACWPVGLGEGPRRPGRKRDRAGRKGHRESKDAATIADFYGTELTSLPIGRWILVWVVDPTAQAWARKKGEEPCIVLRQREDPHHRRGPAHGLRLQAWRGATPCRVDHNPGQPLPTYPTRPAQQRTSYMEDIKKAPVGPPATTAERYYY